MGTKRTAAGGEIVQVQGGHIVRPTGQKDRHSKVFTAKGPRDRRLRLSAHTAIQFYDVQDRLGYDRPSKAVDWLISKAQSAIDQLAHLPPFHPTAAGAHGGSGDIALPDGSESSGYDFQLQNQSLDPDAMKSFFPTSSSASFIKFQSYPPDLCSRTTDKDLCLSLQSFQDSANRTPSTDQMTLFTGDGGGAALDPNFQNRGAGAGFMFGSPQQSWMLSSQRGPLQSGFAEPSSMMTSSDHRSRFGLPEFFPLPQIHGQDVPSSASPSISQH